MKKYTSHRPKKVTRLILFQNFHRHLPQQAAEDLHHVPEVEEREAEEETKAFLIIVANMWRKLEKNEEKTSAYLLSLQTHEENL